MNQVDVYNEFLFFTDFSFCKRNLYCILHRNWMGLIVIQRMSQSRYESQKIHRTATCEDWGKRTRTNTSSSLMRFAFVALFSNTPHSSNFRIKYATLGVSTTLALLQFLLFSSFVHCERPLHFVMRVLVYSCENRMFVALTNSSVGLLAWS